MAACCGKAIIRGGDLFLSDRLVEYGKDAFADAFDHARTVMWVFVFYSEEEKCPVCKSKLDEFFDWFNKYNLLGDPVRMVRAVVEDEPEKNLIISDIGFRKIPMVMFCRPNGDIFHINPAIPDAEWLESHILPIIQADGKVL